MTVPILRDIPESFETERLLIRAPRPGDGAEQFAAVTESLPELRPWMPWAQEAPTVAESEQNIREAWARFVLREDLRLLLFLRSEPDTLVGSSGLHRIDWDAGRFEIGYWVRTRFAGQGLVTEAVRAIASHAFRFLGANRLEIWCDSRNLRSAAVARRVGFVHEGTFSDHTRGLDGTMVTDLCFRLLRNEAEEVLDIDLKPAGLPSPHPSRG
jgi:RimJ/RimL family protein N-acetyltransferase